MSYQIPHIRIENGIKIFSYPSDLASQPTVGTYIRDRVARGLWFNLSLQEWQHTEIVDPSQLTEQDNDRAWLRVSGCPKRYQQEFVD